MDHISANLAFGGREKNIWGYKKLQGGKKPMRKTEKEKKSGDLFFCYFFLETVKNLWGAAKKNSRGAPNGNVTPLVATGASLLISLFWMISRLRPVA